MTAGNCFKCWQALQQWIIQCKFLLNVYVRKLQFFVKSLTAFVIPVLETIDVFLSPENVYMSVPMLFSMLMVFKRFRRILAMTSRFTKHPKKDRRVITMRLCNLCTWAFRYLPSLVRDYLAKTSWISLTLFFPALFVLCPSQINWHLHHIRK